MMKLFVALVIFGIVECAPQRRPPPQDVTSGGPIYVKGLLSQIHEIRNNVHENGQRIVSSILEPVGRLGRPYHDHRKGGRPNENADVRLKQRTQLPNENNQPAQEKKRKENPKEVEKDEVPSMVLPPPPTGGLPPPPSSGTSLSTEDWSHVVAPASDKDKPTDDLKRKIISAPCLGGLTANGECRPSFDG